MFWLARLIKVNFTLLSRKVRLIEYWQVLDTSELRFAIAPEVKITGFRLQHSLFDP